MKFEYMIETWRFDPTLDRLNQYGEAGWELVAIVPDGQFKVWYFKRALIVR